MLEADTISPHGGTLVDLLATGPDAERLLQEAEHLPKITVNARELSDLEMLTVGALSPLTGFVGERDYQSILDSMHLASGPAWTIPVTLSLDEGEVKRIGGAEAVALLSEEGGSPLAVLEVAEIYKRDRQKEALGVFGTEDLEHPGVAALHDRRGEGDPLARARRFPALPAHSHTDP